MLPSLKQTAHTKKKRHGRNQMSRKNTKADRILNDSAMRLEAARLRVQTACAQLNSANLVFEAVQEAHNALEKELAPTPRRSSKKPVASPVASKEQAKDEKIAPGLCSHVFEGGKHCLAAPSNAIHDPEFEYAGHHEFEGPKLVARAPRKSRVRSETRSSDQNSGTVTNDGGSVTHVATAGD